MKIYLIHLGNKSLSVCESKWKKPTTLAREEYSDRTIQAQNPQTLAELLVGSKWNIEWRVEERHDGYQLYPPHHHHHHDHHTPDQLHEQ